jgi:ubiquinone/menaquinone biosynthesis C-methylase UbiE
VHLRAHRLSHLILNFAFADNTFDFTFSNAVIEHVGNRKNQETFIKECIRISRKYVFIATPNRYYPIELHTALPIIHWLPPTLFRRIMVGINKPFFASEDNLNLLSKRDIVKIMGAFVDVRYTLRTIRFFGFQSNILLTIIK